MAAKTTNYADALLKLIFNGTTIANLADNTVTSPATILYVSLHTATPGVGGSQNTNEAAYGSYARQPVNRNSGGWTVTTNSVSPVAPVVFATASGGSETETFFGVGLSSTGAGTLLYFGPISPNIVVTSGITPELTAASAVTET